VPPGRAAGGAGDRALRADPGRQVDRRGVPGLQAVLLRGAALAGPPERPPAGLRGPEGGDRRARGPRPEGAVREDYPATPVEDGALKTDILSGTEKEIIRGFIDVVSKMDPDVITGYNIDGYDLPILEQRARVHGIMNLPLSRDGQGISNINERFWRAHGRIIA